MLNAPAPTPLAVHQLCHPDGGVLQLGVLGASHVITVGNPDLAFSEQISCTRPTNGESLPECAEAPGYRLRSHTSDYGGIEFRRIAHRLRHRCHHESDWLGGTFPGDEAALTAISAHADGPGWHWQTWHLYPAATGRGTIVYTESRWQP